MNCVCGHPKESHPPCEECASGHPSPCRECGCYPYRACLPWPDSEGWWWTTNNKDSQALVEVTGIVGHFLKLSGRGWYRNEYEKQYGPARFTKLIEQNPFGPDPTS